MIVGPYRSLPPPADEVLVVQLLAAPYKYMDQVNVSGICAELARHRFVNHGFYLGLVFASAAQVIALYPGRAAIVLGAGT